MSYGAFFTFYDNNDEDVMLKASDTQLSLIGGTQSLLMLGLSFIMGRLLDAGFHRPIAAGGVVSLSVGFLCTGFAGHKSHYGLLWLTNALLVGLGLTCFFVFSTHNAIRVCANLCALQYNLGHLAGDRTNEHLDGQHSLNEGPLV